jgi:hypothetical protein
MALATMWESTARSLDANVYYILTQDCVNRLREANEWDRQGLSLRKTEESNFDRWQEKKSFLYSVSAGSEDHLASYPTDRRG